MRHHLRDTWHYQELLRWFTDVCWHETAARYAAALYQLHITLSCKFLLLEIAA